MPESPIEEVTPSRGPARISLRASSDRENRPRLQSHAEQGGIQRYLRQFGVASQPVQLARLFGSGDFAHSANDVQKVRLLGTMQRQHGNNYVGRVLQRTCEPGSSGSGSSSTWQEDVLQRRSEGGATAPLDRFDHAMQRAGTGNSLDPETQSMMEERFGQRFGDVRVHTDSAAETAASEIHAQAFTTGRNIYFGTGRYQPETHEGQHLLAHELAHVVQQRGGAIGSGMAKPLLSTPGDAFEREADAAANQAMQGQPVSINGVTSGQPAPVQCAPRGRRPARPPCAVPTNFRKTAASDAGGGVLHFEFAWGSSTGSLADLGACEVGEHVAYTHTADPPFAAAPNPTVIWLPGTDGALQDNHSPGAVKPYRNYTERATQYYRYHCPCSHRGNPVNLMGPISITRRIIRKPDGNFRYKITKLGKSAAIDPLP